MSDDMAERTFEIETPLGTIRCCASDFVVGVHAVPYPLALGEFAMTYTPPVDEGP